MKVINFGEYVIKSSLMVYYQVEKTSGCTESYLITLFLKNGNSLLTLVDDDDVLEEIKKELDEGLKESE